MQRATGELLRDNTKLNQAENEQLKQELRQKEKEVLKLRAMLNAQQAMLNAAIKSPSPATSGSRLNTAASSAILESLNNTGRLLETVMEEGEEAADTDMSPSDAKRRRTEDVEGTGNTAASSEGTSTTTKASDTSMSSTRSSSSSNNIDTVSQSQQPPQLGVPNQQVTVGGITVTDELDRLYTVYHGKRTTSNDEQVQQPVAHKSKNAIYKEGSLLLGGVNPAFDASSEAARYRKGMTLVAMSITDEQWKSFVEGTIESSEQRQIFCDIQEATMLTTFELEVQSDVRVAGSKCKAFPTIHSLGNWYAKIIVGLRKLSYNDMQIEDLVHKKIHGRSSTSQTSLNRFFSGGNN